MGVNQMQASPAAGFDEVPKKKMPVKIISRVWPADAGIAGTETETASRRREDPAAIPDCLHRKTPGYLNPLAVLAFLVLWIILVEGLSMVIISYFPQISRGEEHVLDGILLITLISPVYLLLYRPLKAHWEQHNRCEDEIVCLSQKVISSSDEERRRLARDLHDECGGLLAALQFKMETLKHQVSHDSSRTLEQADQAIGMLTQLSGNLRGILNRRRHVMLEQFGLVNTLSLMIEEHTGHWPGVKVDFNVEGQHGQLSPDVKLALFHICQEGLSNAAKYARADRIDIRLEREEKWVVLSIKDNGRGIVKQRESIQSGRRGKGFGLHSMRERAVILGGSFELLSTLDAGVLVRVRLPLVPQETE